MTQVALNGVTLILFIQWVIRCVMHIVHSELSQLQLPFEAN